MLFSRSFDAFSSWYLLDEVKYFNLVLSLRDAN